MVKEVENVENQLHNMVNIFINSIDRECCGFITTSLSIKGDFVPTIANISSIMINPLPWPLLAKQHDFWKPKS
jgi:hypothetical protein